jgi:hypothetical protein
MGVMIADVHCLPLGRSTGWKGDPVATRARPSVHFKASSVSVSFEPREARFR